MQKKPFVGIIMGSDSDLLVMREAAEVLKEFGVPCEVKVLSAHRTPDQTTRYAKSAVQHGLKVIIAGAGGAAHLAGVVAAMTPLPIIAVPIKTTTMKGIDSLFSMAQMPPGVPVATVGINAGKNAGLLAVQILATADKKLSKKFIQYKRGLAASVIAKTKKLERLGIAAYLRSAQ